MKKAIIISTFFVLLMTVTIFADSGAEPTNKRLATDFSELFMYRLSQSMLSGLIGDIQPNSAGIAFHDPRDNTMKVSITGGSLSVNQDDFTIEEATFYLHNFAGTNEENQINFYTASIGLSALEYSQFDDTLFGITTKTSSNNAAEEGLRILNEQYDDFVYSDDLDKAFDGEDVLIYSGNYDYFIRYEYDEEHNIDRFKLIAKAR